MSNVCGKRQFFSFFVMLVMLFSIGLAYSGTTMAADSKVRELKWATFVPENAFDAPPLKQFVQDIEKYTNGAIKIRLFWPGQIAEIKEMPELTRRGSLDMTTTSPTFYPSIFPLNVALQSFPMLFESTEQATYVWRGLFRDIPELQKEFAAQNQYCLNRGSLAEYITLSKKPLRTMADLKGLKVRSLPGKYFSEIMESAGAVPLVNPISEVYEGLMRGSLDAVMLNIQVFESLKFYETAKYVSLPVGTMVGYWISINLDVWNSFTPEIKKAFTRASDEWGVRLLGLILSTNASSIQNLKDRGVQFVQFSKTDWQTMIAKAGDPWIVAKDYLVKDLKVDPGVAERFIKRWRELTNEYNQKYTATGKKWKYE